MKLRRTNKYWEYEIELSKAEYIEIAKEHNKKYWYRPEHMYDIDEMENTLNDVETITMEMLDDCETGFWMWSEDFWKLFLTHTDWPNDDNNYSYEVEVQL